MKIKIFIFSLFISCFLLISKVFGNNPSIDSINIQVILNKDGSANVTEIWDVNVVQGTEWYLEMGNMFDMEINNFTVKDESLIEYENIGEWDVNASFDQKTNKCGIVDYGNNNYELCWGVGSYGRHTFYASYKITNLIKGYSDFDGFNHLFVNKGLSSNPQSIQVTIEYPNNILDFNNSKIWSFGYDGEINFIDGKIIAVSNNVLNSSDSVIILTSFEKGLFQPEIQIDFSFEEIKNTAFIDSSYSQNNSSKSEYFQPDNYSQSNNYSKSYNSYSSSRNFFSNLFFVFFILLFLSPFLIIIFLLIFNHKKYKLKNSIIKEIKSNIDYYRDIPLEGDIPLTSFILKELSLNPSDGDIIGAYFLKWTKNKIIDIEVVENKGFFGKEKMLIKFNDYDSSLDQIELKLYNLLLKASGPDKILEPNEFNKWLRKNYNIMINYMNEFYESGKERANKKNLFDIVNKVSIFNEKGTQEAKKILGLKKYLKDFSIINERRVLEVHLWDNYLIFASIYGIADKVAKDLENIYPEYFTSPYKNDNGINLSRMILISHIHNFSSSYDSTIHASTSSSSSSISSSGGGGHSSFGGGGGHSGGGSGGGGSR